MEKNIVTAVLELLKRTELKGSEVEAYVSVVNALQAELNKEETTNEE